MEDNTIIRDRRNKKDISIKRVIDSITDEELSQVNLRRIRPTFEYHVLLGLVSIALILSFIHLIKALSSVDTTSIFAYFILIMVSYMIIRFVHTKSLSTIFVNTYKYRATYMDKDIDLEVNMFIPEEEVKRLIVLMGRDGKLED